MIRFLVTSVLNQNVSTSSWLSRSLVNRAVTSFFLACLSVGGLMSLPEAACAGGYTISVDGQEVLDSETGLIWRRCIEGMRWNGSACAGTPLYSMWHDALHHAESERQKTGIAWRLPNVKELASLVDTEAADMAIDAAVFPATPHDHFWCSTPYSADAFYAWVVHFYFGSVYYTYLEDNGAIRLVRDQP